MLCEGNQMLIGHASLQHVHKITDLRPRWCQYQLFWFYITLNRIRAHAGDWVGRAARSRDVLSNCSQEIIYCDVTLLCQCKNYD